MSILVKFDLDRFFLNISFFLKKQDHTYPHSPTLIPPCALQHVPITTSHLLMCLLVNHPLGPMSGANVTVGVCSSTGV